MIPLTESILQSCFKQKTIYRNAEWDIIWYLGGKNNVRIGEKSGKFYLLPSSDPKPIIELLPAGLIQAEITSKESVPILIETLKDLERIYPELGILIKAGKIKI